MQKFIYNEKGELKMEELLEILEEMKPGVDFKT